ncbi:MAG: DUF4173 domain-containing protein [Flavobacteriaceae bacterium]
MKLKDSILAVFLFTFLFVFLFYKQWLGINLVIFEIFFLGYLYFSKELHFTRNLTLTFSFLLATLIATIINYSLISYWIHFLVLIVFMGLVKHKKIKSVLSALGIGIESLFVNQLVFFEKLSSLKIKERKIGAIAFKYYIYIIPFIIILLFLGMYSASNPIFSDFVEKILNTIWKGILYVTENISISLIGVFLLGIFLMNFLLLKNKHLTLFKVDQKSHDSLLRINIKQKRVFKLTALKTEYKIGIFLFSALNVLLLSLNISDVIWVWMNFEWEGQTLKGFVHEGTYLLIFSILISIVLALFFFRKNINFLPNNRLLKILSYIWILQNAFLALSVLRRNLWYIDYFALAYKRIGVFIFLMVIGFGLYTVFQKIKYKKSIYYLFRVNILSLLITLTCTALINWDVVIAKYNFNHYNSSYVHIDWLGNLSNKTLPYLKKNSEFLEKVEKAQKKFYPNLDFSQDYTSYKSDINFRVKNFKTLWEQKPLLSWNYAEYKAYKKLIQN